MVAVTAPQQKLKFLVIMLGGLEEFILSTGAFKAIRKKFEGHHITLLTTEPFVELGRHSGYFNEVVADPVINMVTDPIRYYNFIKAIRSARFNGVFDLQCVKRTEWYFRFLGKNKPDWNGHIDWCSHPYVNPMRWQMHVQDWQEEQLAVANIVGVGEPDVSWVRSDISRFDLPEKFVIFFPGGRDYTFTRKGEQGEEEDVDLPPRWHGEKFAEVAVWLHEQGITPVMLGSEEEVVLASSAASLFGNLPTLNLVGKTGVADIVEIARLAKGAVGNDNEAMWLVAAAKCPSVLIFPSLVQFRQRVPRGQHVEILEQPNLDLLTSKEVCRALQALMMLDTAPESAKPAVSGGAVPPEQKDSAHGAGTGTPA